MVDAIHDQSVREQALQADASFIIQAPAGSGKTGLLIKRYLRLLSLVDAPEEITAITFTRKAAAEMQGRILQALVRAVEGEQPGNEHERETWTLARAALARDKVRGWDIISNPGRLRIQTIDALCASLTKRLPLLSQLGSQPEIVEDARPLYEQAAASTLAELEAGEGWSEAIANLVFHLDNDLPRIKRLIVDMLFKRDQWMPYVLQEHDRNNMEQALGRLVEEQLEILRRRFPAEQEQTCLALLHYTGNNLLAANPQHPLAQVADLKAFPTASAADVSTWQAIRELLLTRDNSWRSPRGLNIKCGFPAPSEKGLDAADRDKRQAMKLAMENLLHDLQEVDGLHSALDVLSILPAAEFTDAEWRIVNALTELLRLAAVQLNLLFAERNQMDFIGIAEKAVLALGTDDNPTELARHLDYQLRHLLVDEFQDVSVSQARLIKALTREWSLEDGRSLFLVGDPMQSIYRFREADVSIFIRTFHDGYLGQVPLTALKLGMNFRSRQALVDWFNECFQKVFPAQDNVSKGAVAYSQSQAFQQENTNDDVTVYPLYGRDFKDEADKVTTLVAEIQASNPDDSIAILVRGRTHLREIVPGLRAAGLRFQALDIERLHTQAAIQDLLALTRAWLYPADRVAWLACLRAPWCGLSLASLYQLCHADKNRLLLDCLRDPELLKQLQDDERQRAERTSSILNKAWQERQRSTLRVAIESLWYQLGGPATLANHNDLENCRTFFQLLEQIESGGGIARLEELVQAVDELYASPDELAGSQFQLMTIHKAKGLEFDHVILPGLGRATRGSSDELLAWLLRETEQFEDLILAPIREAGAEPSAIYSYINATRKEKQHYEDQRLLYVACTRSRKTLHLLGHVRLKDNDGEVVCEPDSRSLLVYLWPVVASVYEQYCPAQITETSENNGITISLGNKRLQSGWQLPELPADMTLTTAIVDDMQPELLIEYEWAGETIKHIGSAVHRIIQWIAEQGLAAWSLQRVRQEQGSFLALLTQLGVPGEDMEQSLAQVSQAISQLIDDERGRWILSDAHHDAHNEYSISGLHDGKVINAILDRTFIDDKGVRWVIDYKTSRHEGKDMETFLDREQERYQQQLEAYGSLLRHMGDEPVRLALYFPLLQGWREWAMP